MTARRAPDRLAAEVARAAARRGARRTLLLDLDGTLAPIAATPESACVPDAVLAALQRLVTGGWKVAIVSGRPVTEVHALVPVAGVRVFGGHGAEPGTTVRRMRRPRRLMVRLAPLASAARRLARGAPGAHVERKPCGIALHDRRVARTDLRRWRSAVRSLLARSDLAGLEVLRGRRVIEVRPRGDNKGIVLGSLVERQDGAWTDSSVVALGDDRTDEDLFRALRGRGLAVRVGREIRATAAARRLASPAAVRRFLEALAATTARPRARRRG